MAFLRGTEERTRYTHLPPARLCKHSRCRTIRNPNDSVNTVPRCLRPPPPRACCGIHRHPNSNRRVAEEEACQETGVPRSGDTRGSIPRRRAQLVGTLSLPNRSGVVIVRTLPESALQCRAASAAAAAAAVVCLVLRGLSSVAAAVAAAAWSGVNREAERQRESCQHVRVG